MGQDHIAALCIAIEGAVQGVGFRPFVYRLSRELNLKGFVRNSPSGVNIVVEGRLTDLACYVQRLKSQAPQQALIQKLEYFPVELKGYLDFSIITSVSGPYPKTIALPDLATCVECRTEIFDAKNRRFRYPFTNCTHCGPRYSILESLPYDRIRTSMKSFLMCPECEKEFYDPDDRRFHAQPNACWGCGPRLELWSTGKVVLEKEKRALECAVDALRAGKILALKGLGGFQLLVDAGNQEAVQVLRQRKHREQKPFAVLFPSIDWVRRYCLVSALEEDLLFSAVAPIVLLSKISSERDFQGVAPGNPYLGAMLPYTPLHHLLMADLDFPVVATSGNISDEPICIDEHEAVERLGKIADFFLVHNRPIVRPMDDSVVRVIKEQPCVLRRARGYAPLPISVEDQEIAVLALGAHYKNTVALKVNQNVFLSQHIGDLQTAGAMRAFERALEDLRELYAPPAIHYVCDLHPEYFPTRFARASSEKVCAVQHHHSHIVSCMAEHGVNEEVLGLAWDGTGLGDDGTIWGGEFLLCTRREYQRLGHLRTFRLPGGDAAIRQPRKTAFGILYELFSGQCASYSDLPCFWDFSSGELKNLGQMLVNGMNSPLTSSMGRLFDAVSSIAGICQYSSFEGQSAIMLEFALAGKAGQESYGCDLKEIKIGNNIKLIFDWAQMIHGVISDTQSQVPPAIISLKFHNTLVELGVQVAQYARRKNVVLSGGCFQNKYLLEHLIDRLQSQGFVVHWPQQVPANDGGIAFGQAMIAVSRIKEGLLCV